MALSKVTYTDNVTVIYADNLNNIQDAIIALESGAAPAPYTSLPANLGTAAAGSASAYARGDHVHAMPSASDIGAIPAPSSPSFGQYLMWNGSAWVAQSLPLYNGGVS